MPYDILATSQTPALIIYLLDVSASMGQPLGSKRRIDVVTDALTAALREMVFRSTKGSLLHPRYRLAVLAYSDHVYDVYGGIKTVDQAAVMGVPELSPLRTTDTARAFEQAEKLLRGEVAGLRACPAPLICHMTDGEYTGDDPEPVVNRIRQLGVPDGRVLVENIFISEKVLIQPILNLAQWPGILPDTPLQNEYACKLRALSSPVPESYRLMMQENNYHLTRGAVMLFPGTSPELVTMGFQMSHATLVR